MSNKWSLVAYCKMNTRWRKLKDRRSDTLLNKTWISIPASTWFINEIQFLTVITIKTQVYPPHVFKLG